jgi:hypothetical protein
VTDRRASGTAIIGVDRNEHPGATLCTSALDEALAATP